MPGLNEITCFLFDNGSFRGESTLSLRRIARRLEAKLRCRVIPTSLLHSTRVDAVELDGTPATLLEPELMRFGGSGGRNAIALPLFFGESGALTEYLPDRIKLIGEHWPELKIKIAGCLVNDSDDSVGLVAQAMAGQIRALKDDERDTVDGDRPWVISTDHGSPKIAVAKIRNLIGTALKLSLGAEVLNCQVASMERRDGPEYGFNEPLLASALEVAVRGGAQRIIVAQQFLQPGRHAGAAGDITEICNVAKKHHPSLMISQTQVLGAQPEIEALLIRRFQSEVRTMISTQ